MKEPILLPKSIQDYQEIITISYRGQLAEKVSAINCTDGRTALFQNLVATKFTDCLCHFDEKGRFVIGRIDDIGKYYPHW